MKNKINLTKAGKITIVISSIMAAVFIALGVFFGLGLNDPRSKLKFQIYNNYYIEETYRNYEYILEVESYGGYEIKIKNGDVISLKDMQGNEECVELFDELSSTKRYRTVYISSGKYVLTIYAKSSQISIYYTYA